jgi:translation initiation factor IF-3
MNVKEIRFNANTDSHDIDFKTRHLKQFLIDGHKVKATVIYKGRMITHPEFGRQLMDDILAKLSEVGKIEAPPKMEGKMLTSYLIPDKVKIQAYENKLAKETKSESVKPEIKEDNTK